MPLGNRNAITLYNATEPFPLASVSKLLIFIEFARRVDAGTLSLDELVEVETLNRYDLPRTNRNAHERFLEQYPPDTQSIRLWDIAATGMMQYSSNAAADFLLERLGYIDWTSLYQRLNLNGTGYPHSMSMIPLLMTNHETGQATAADVESLSITQGEALFERYVQDAEWRQLELAYRAGRRSFPAWNVQAAILQQHTVTGTTYDFLNVLTAVYDLGGPLSENTKQMVRAALKWNDNEFIDSAYLEYGSKLGYYSGGTLALVAYGHLYTGHPVISAVFMRNIPRRVYSELLEQDAIGDLAHWMNLNECAGLLEPILRAN
jgi:hypothetical protein